MFELVFDLNKVSALFGGMNWFEMIPLVFFTDIPYESKRLLLREI